MIGGGGPESSRINAFSGANERWNGSLIQHLAAGALARCTAVCIMMPIDTVKTRMQFLNGRTGRAASGRTYSGLGVAFSTITREEGIIRGFYRGLPPRLVYTGPAAAVSFAVYEEVKASLGGASTWHPAVPLAAGLSARLFGTAVRTPFDIVKQRLQVDGALKKSRYRGMLHAFKDIIATEGLRKGLLAGYTVTLLRDAPFAGIYFTTYEYLKKLQGGSLLNVKGGDGLHAGNHLIAGATAGAVASTATIPVDVVKTRLQTQAVTAGSVVQYSGVVDAFKSILAEEGPRGFVRGLGARLLYIMPASSITFAAYEAYKTAFSTLQI